MGKIIIVAKGVFFLFLGGVLFLILQILLKPARYGTVDYYDETTRQLEGFYDEKMDSIDIVFLGTSHMNAGLIPMELYKEYGLKSYNLATSAQPIEASYYLLKEALKTQSPSLCVIDASGLWIEEPQEYAWRYVIDNIKSDLSMLQLAKMYYQCDFDQLLTYGFPAFYYHDRWKSLEFQDFMEFRRNKHFFSKGNLIFSLQRVNPASIDVDFMNEEANRLEDSQQYVFSKLESKRIDWLLKIAELCRQNNIEILVTKIPAIYHVADYGSAWTRKKSDITKEVCANHHIPYYDMLYDVDVNLDWSTDTVDGGMHLNYRGGKKVTSCIGAYIVDEYEIAGSNDNIWDVDFAIYSKMKDVIELQMQGEYENYIKGLQGWEDNDIAVLIATADTYNTGLHVEELNELVKLGLNTDFMSEQNKAYVAVIRSGRVIYEASAADITEYDWYVGKVACTLSSAGPEGGSAASIQIGGQEYAIGARGFNVVVYDCEKNLVLDSKCFDTYEFVHKVLIDNQLVYAMDVENYLIENK